MPMERLRLREGPPLGNSDPEKDFPIPTSPVQLLDLAHKKTGHSVKFEFQINNKCFLA